MSRIWLNSNVIINNYENLCMSCAVGLRTINPKRIVALSRPYAEISIDSNMSTLRRRVSEQGWKDPQPKMLDVFRVPDGTLIVVRGGNHRAVLANELALTEVTANVTVLVPYEAIPASVMDRHAELEAAYDREVELYHQRQAQRGALDDVDMDEFDAMESADQLVREHEKRIGLSYLRTVRDDLL